MKKTYDAAAGTYTYGVATRIVNGSAGYTSPIVMTDAITVA